MCILYAKIRKIIKRRGFKRGQRNQKEIRKEENRLFDTVRNVKNTFVKRETAEVKHINRILNEKIKKYSLKLFLNLKNIRYN